jgi:ribonucleoside-diphosphate reductase alpha chain
VLGSVLSITPAAASPAPAVAREAPTDIDTRVDDTNRRLAIQSLPMPVLASLVWPGRPELPSGNPSWTYVLRHPGGEFALFVGHVEEDDGRTFPFEVWVNGAEQPRGMSALAKTLSMDMRANDRAWLKLKLDRLATTPGEQAFEIAFPPRGEKRLVPGTVAAFAQIVRWRCEQLGALDEKQPDLLSPAGRPHPVLDALFAQDEPRTGTEGTLAWTVDVVNPASGEDFMLCLKEITLPDGVTRPYALQFAGHYPRALDGLARLLSLDMRVIDPAWIGMKLRKLVNVGEPLGDFMAFVPGEKRQRNFPSTVAYVAQLVIHRYAQLGILDESGLPVRDMGVLDAPRAAGDAAVQAGRTCPECGNATVIRKDGCDFCTACGAVGACG